MDSGSPRTCLLCASQRNIAFRSQFRRCLDCGVVAFPQEQLLTPLSHFYERDYFEGSIYRSYSNEASFRLDLFTRKVKLVERFLPSSGRILDVGCACGFFLEVMRRRGYEVEGVEISSYAADWGRKNLNLTIHNMDLVEGDLPDDGFDLVTLWDVVEHLADPLATLREVRRILKPNGVVLLETMNRDSLMEKILGARWPLYKPPWHLFYFNHRSLRSLIRNAGFLLRKAIPIQTYLPRGRAIVPWRYFESAGLRRVLGPLVPDVSLFVLHPQTQVS